MFDQKELIQLLVSQLSIIRTLNILAILAVIVGPISAVLITLWYQARKQKFDSKNRLFLTLMAHRKSFHLNPEGVNALNMISVVFADNPSVVALWNDFYNLLAGDLEKNKQERDHKYLEMLSAMARVLGYKSLSQTDIDKFYYPKSFVDQLETNAKVQKEFLQVLENSARFVVDKRGTGQNPLQ